MLSWQKYSKSSDTSRPPGWIFSIVAHQRDIVDDNLSLSHSLLNSTCSDRKCFDNCLSEDRENFENFHCSNVVTRQRQSANFMITNVHCEIITDVWTRVMKSLLTSSRMHEFMMRIIFLLHICLMIFDELKNKQIIHRRCEKYQKMFYLSEGIFKQILFHDQKITRETFRRGFWKFAS